MCACMCVCACARLWCVVVYVHVCRRGCVGVCSCVYMDTGMHVCRYCLYVYVLKCVPIFVYVCIYVCMCV